MGVAIRTAGEGDRELIVRLLDEAFQDDPVSGWVFPGVEDRRAKHPRLMAAFTDIVLAAGRIDVTEDGSACALWLSVPADEGNEDAEDEGPAQVREAVDPDNERVERIGRLMAAIHPTGRAHEYLWMIGVAVRTRAWAPHSSRQSSTAATVKGCPPTWRPATPVAATCTSAWVSSRPVRPSNCRTARRCGPCGASPGLTGPPRGAVRGRW
jgi:hypothetical protein